MSVGYSHRIQCRRCSVDSPFSTSQSEAHKEPHLVAGICFASAALILKMCLNAHGLALMPHWLRRTAHHLKRAT